MPTRAAAMEKAARARESGGACVQEAEEIASSFKSKIRGSGMNRTRKTGLILCLVAGLVGGKSWSLWAADDEANSVGATDAEILTEIHEHSELMNNLEYLSDRIGPRLTGSPLLKRANDWTAEMFRKYGLTNVHLEPYTIAHAWIRGTAKASILRPTEHPLTIASAAWSPNTKGLVRGPVVYFDAKKPEEYPKFHGKLKGAIVITQEPRPLSPPQPLDANFIVRRPMQEPPPPVGQPAFPDPYDKILETQNAESKFFLAEGAVAVLRDSGKPHGLLNMTDSTSEPFHVGAIPTAFVTGEGYRMIYRMLKNEPVEVELEIKNSVSAKPVEVYNTVADLRGSEKPEEMVILGGHLDSWDLATGATDDGTGAMAVLEAARALAKLDVRPKRTIRFVLFSGEEQGLIGSKEYVKAHKDELSKISGVLIHDTGTGRVLTIGMHDNYQARAKVDQVIAPLGELKLLEPSMRRTYGEDSFSFAEVGVPGFWCEQSLAEYRLTHHSQSDTFDKVWKDDINQGAQVLAAWAYNTANLPELLPRRQFTPREAGADTKTETSKADPMQEADKKIVERVKADEEQLKTDLTYLTTQIGPRLTGSVQMDQASHWTEEKFKALGLENVHREPWTIANSWTRGMARARVTSPVTRDLTLATMGWAPGTNGTVKAELIGIEATKPEELEKYKGKLEGKIVLFGRARELEPPVDPFLTPWGKSTIPISHPEDSKAIDLRASRSMRLAAMKMMAEEKALALLGASDKTFGLLNMTSVSNDYQPAKFPAAFVSREDYQELWQLLDAGTPVELELNLQASFSGKPVEVYNTVAEIRGSGKPDEVVILGAHLDSWDLGTGATDNGTGSMAVLEAARALEALGVKPKRTIRFVLFSGEEQGLNGSKAYVEAHKEELAKVSGMLVHDSGTGKVLSIGLMGNYAAMETMHRALYPLVELVGILEPSVRSEGGSDHVPFDAAGVPGFWCVQEPAEYEKLHHSQSDVLEHVRWDELAEGAEVLAVFAYNVAELPDLLPRKPAQAEEKK
jgi:carboxypeptidase Q